MQILCNIYALSSGEKIRPKVHKWRKNEKFQVCVYVKTAPKVQRTQGIEYWSNFSLVLFGKGREKHRTTSTTACNNFSKCI